MISLLLPYWERQEATDKALCLMAQHYMDLDLEIIIVDDGSPEPFVAPTLLPLDIKVWRLPTKIEAKNACAPYNAGAQIAKGDFIAISNPENLHRKPILEAMRDAVKGDADYVMAAAWSEEQKRWHAHSSMTRNNVNDVGAYVPREAQYHFMTMMRRSLWDKSGGFDEDYRDGAGYDDPDFVRRLHAAGANFIMRDDLIVEHPRAGAHAKWTKGGFARNRALFLSKWQPL